MAKAVPLCLVETQPNTIAKARPPNPPTNGMTGTGSGRPPAIAAFMPWTAK